MSSGCGGSEVQLDSSHATAPNCRRWWHQRLVERLSSWPAAAAYARSFVPTPWSAVILLLMGSFVVSCVEQFAQSHALEADTERLKRERHRHVE